MDYHSKGRCEMKIEVVRNLLQDKAGFSPLFHENEEKSLVFETEDNNLIQQELELLRKNFWNSGLEAWISPQRVAVTKAYKSYTYFEQSWRQDQIIISDLLNYLHLKYKNNLYFLIILEFDPSNELDNKLLIEKNRAEKNAKYCRKYLIQDDIDLERIPFFFNIEAPIEDSFSYEQKFIDKLVLETHGLSPNVIQVIHKYFEPEIRSALNDKVALKVLIEERLGEEENNADLPTIN